ncbi:MAG: hypothetical protein J6A61_08815 [Clostridia bacterium]|nr:hypothetical protein [Clostridia bacterium]
MQYIVCYPCSDEEGFDGIHDGGWKGVRDDAPDEAKQAFQKFLEEEKENLKNHVKV